MDHHHSAGPIHEANSRLRGAAIRLFTVAAVCMTAALLVHTEGTFGSPPSQTLDAAPPEQRPNAPGIAPAAESAPELLVRPPQPGADLASVWNSPSLFGGPRAETLLYDNGEPLDDYGDPASQLSATGLGDWHFVAAAADDFILPNLGLPERNYRITKVRAAFTFFNGGSGDEDPSDWEGIHVTVFENSHLSMPDGSPDFTGVPLPYISTQLVPAASLEFTTAGTCRSCFVIEIPVNLVLAKNVQYWLSLMPDYDAPPQTAWCLSTQDTNFHAQRGASFGPPFWNEAAGNTHSGECPDSPPAHTKKDLSFQLYGEELSAAEGACCDTSNGECSDVLNPAACAGPFKVFHPGVECQFLSPPCEVVTGACCDDAIPDCDERSVANCQGPTQRFEPGQVCELLDPPCGTMELGACCMPGQVCDDLSPTDCDAVGGVWNVGECATYECPPDNDDCANVITIEDGSYAFNNQGATTDGPPLDPSPAACAEVGQDVWFRYVATCTGTVVVSLCLDTNYDSALAVYEGCTCPPSTGLQVACDNDACTPSGASEVSFAATSGMCYLIRVGGVGAATGSGTIVVGCIPADSGACCHFDGSCEVSLESECVQPGDEWHSGLPCSLADCPVYVGACCDESIGTCRDVEDQAECAGEFEVFHEDEACGEFVCEPAVGACCLPDRSCTDLTFADCGAQGGDWHLGSCAGPPPFQCPPNNDDCGNAMPIMDGSHVFDTLWATTDGPALDPGSPECAEVNHDVWFSYVATCDGTLVVSLCTGTSYDSALAVYQGCDCLPSLGTQLVCDNDACGAGGASEVLLPVTMGACYLIRVGGVDDATGSGTISVNCYPEVLGACCLVPEGTCNRSAADECLPPDFFKPYEHCSLADCPPPVDTHCCRGDTNGDGVLDGRDIQLFVQWLGGLNPPEIGADEFCRTDVNRDYRIDLDDIQPFVDKLLNAEACPPPPAECCNGDLNADGLLDGRDVQGLLDVLLGGAPPAFGTQAFCLTDVNDDESIDLSDAAALAQKLVHGKTCPPPPTPGACCDAWSGECRDVGDSSQCGGTYESFYAGAACASIVCEVTIGACCDNATGVCENGRDAVECVGPTRRFGAGTTCDELSPACAACCRGDTNGDGLLDGRDVQGLVEAIIDTPLPGTVAFCQADVNEDDAVGLDDVDALAQKLAGDETGPCPAP